MYRVIGYHGESRNGEVENDLRLIWDSFRNFASQRQIRHIYCFQAIRTNSKPAFESKAGFELGHEANLFLVIQYGEDVATKLALHNKPKLASQLRNHVDYWLYVRDRGEKKC